ncbi:MAG: DUF3604 domain-containing protein [Verrucomicrobia bacterium]|nr:DUF3604 domain-containing protein [Verrucomicrobiota bacterium]
MRRSICVCEPMSCYAGEIGNFRFVYTPAVNLPKGTKLRFDLATKGRNIDWELPQTNVKVKKNLIWAQLPDGKGIPAKAIDKGDKMTQVFEFTLPLEIKAGENFIIYMGSTVKGKDTGNRCQLNVQRRKPFHLYIDPRGKGDFKEQETFHLDVRGNVLHNIRIIAPSLVAKNKRFDVLVRFEDEYGNLTNYAPEGSLIELSYENQRENLNWKLFIPETGFINLPNLYFNEAGVYKIQLQNLKTGDKYFSAPIKCLPESANVICWGLLHAESEKNDAHENIEACLREFRDEKALQFYSTSSFEDETPPEVWKQVSTQVAEFNEEQRFCTFLGFQYPADEGLRQIVYFKDQKPLLRKKEAKSNVLPKIYKLLSPKDALSIPSFTMGKGFETDFKNFEPEFEKVVEIYNAWGSSECTAKEGNPRPIRSTTKNGVQETEAGSILNALKKNRRFGFVAGGLDDRGIYADFYENGQVQYSPGLTAILSTDQTKEALVQALAHRSCYATTGERIIVGLNIAGTSMGGELNTKAKPGLVLNRHIIGYVAGTGPLKEVVLLRNGTPIKTFAVKDFSLDFAFDDSEHLSKAVLTADEGKPPFVFYYLRVTQQDGHMAWSSPIWVDYPDFLPTSTPKKTKK